MAYNKRNLLEKIIEIQEIVLLHKKNYVPQIRIYELHIRDKYHISYSTFNVYLGTPAKARLKELTLAQERRKSDQDNQIEIAFDE
jgi:uncharacterized protein VirK/YbjX